MYNKKPMYIDFALTPYCNLNCGFCYALSSNNFSEETILKPDELDKIFKELDEMEVLRIGFEGGEPFLRKDIIDIFKLADKYNFSYFVNTNGTLITKEIAEELKKTSIDKICVSIDGHNEIINDTSRGKKGAFIKTQEGVKNLIEQDLDVEGVITLSKINKDYIIEILDYMKSLGIKKATIMLLATVGNLSMDISKYYLNYKEWSDILVNLTKLKADNKLPISLSIIPTGEGKYQWELYLPLKENGMLEHINLWVNSNSTSTLDYNEYGCTAGKDNFCIDGYGNVFGCSMMVSFDELKAGNVKEESLKSIWNNSKVFNEIRELKLENITGNCKKCDILQECKGGCRACCFAINKNLNYSDKRCPMTN